MMERAQQRFGRNGLIGSGIFFAVSIIFLIFSIRTKSWRLWKSYSKTSIFSMILALFSHFVTKRIIGPKRAIYLTVGLFFAVLGLTPKKQKKSPGEKVDVVDQILEGVEEEEEEEEDRETKRYKISLSRLRTNSVPLIKASMDSPKAGFIVTNELSSSLEDKVASGSLDDLSVVHELLALSFFRKNAGRHLYEALIGGLSSKNATQIRTYSHGDIIFEKNNECDGIMIVHKGVLGLVYSLPQTKEERKKLKPNDCFGVVTVGDSIGNKDIVKTDPKRSNYCVALADSTVYLVHHSTFFDIWSRRPEVLLSYIQGCLGHLWRIATFVIRDFFHIEEKDKNESPHINDQILEILLSPLGYDISLTHTKQKYLPYSQIYSETKEPLSEDQQKLYIIIEGSVNITSKRTGKQEFIRTNTKGDILGCNPFLADVAVEETATSGETGATILVLSKQDLLKFGTHHSSTVASVLLEISKSLFEMIDTFSSLGLQRVFLKASQPLFEKGQDVKNLYIIVCGRARIFHQIQDGSAFCAGDPFYFSDIAPKRPDHSVSEVGRGGTVGDVSIFLNHSIHENSAYCIRDTEVVRISKTAFHKICTEYPSAMLKFSRVMANQLCNVALRATPNDVFNYSNITTICLFPAAGTSERDLSIFAANFANSLRTFDKTLLVNRATINEVLGFTRSHSSRPESDFSFLEDYVELARLKAWLTQQQESNRFVILQADLWISPWSRLCIHNADRIFVIASPNDSPEVGHAENYLLGTHLKGIESNETPEEAEHSREKWVVQQELIILHKQTSTTPLPKGTCEWLIRRKHIQRHHHIRRDVHSDFDRLSRFITGKAVGVVLGGGGSRGLAHLGILKALEHRNIPIDYICGTSQGAIMAAYYAETLSTQMCEKKCEMLSKGLGTWRNLMKDMTLPFLTFFNGEKFSGLVRSTLGRDVMIEDLWIGYFCICTNVTTVDAKICERGLLWESVRASMTIVGFTPPMFTEEGLLVDGGYVDNLPAEQMRSRIGTGLCIAADVENKEESAVENIKPYQDGVVSGTNILFSNIMRFLFSFPSSFLRRRNPYHMHYPTYLQMMDRMSFLTHQIQFPRAIEHVDYYIRPPIERFSLLDYGLLKEISKVGYEHTLEELKKWQAQAKTYLDENGEDNKSETDGTARARSLLSSLFRSEHLTIAEVNEQNETLTHSDSTSAIVPLLSFRDKMRNQTKTTRIVSHASLADLRLTKSRSLSHF